MKEKVGDNYDIDSDIKKWFNEAEVNAEPQHTIATSIQRFPKDISHRDIQKECKQRDDTYEPYLVQGIIDATNLIKQGEIGIIIYLTNVYNGKQCRLTLWHVADGRLSVGVDEVFPGDVWLAGIGVLRKNLNNS